ncbi:hypothetical protein H0H87_010617 [Tephrocybe sp. NHM501043]|nr:hypothetical protein H0H87_010617 [Tephrocybe sp. NHM501043]
MNVDLNFKDVPGFDVHNYCLGSAQLPLHLLISIAHYLVNVASSKSSFWDNVGNISLPIEQPCKNIVRYPPFYETLVTSHLPIEVKERLKEWGAPIAGVDDIFSLADLEEFQSTDLNSAIDEGFRGQALNNRPLASPTQSPSLYEGSLLKMIPQPHIHPSSSSGSLKPLKLLVPYQKKQPILIPPRTEPFSPSPFARTAWLIPVRGAFPWEQCTAAVILNSFYGAPYSELENKSQIVWTHGSLRTFWAFLLEIKEKKAAGTIGFSFHASCAATLESQPSNATSTAIVGNQLSFSTHSSGTSRMGSNPNGRSQRALWRAVDYIKIYHDAPNAMHVRNILHLWLYVVASPTELQPSEKIRVLKGATFALVDERAVGILLL